MRPARRLPRALALALAAPVLAGAQTAATPGIAKQLQGDYAVPDAPALTLLDAGASRLLRPTSVKSLTAQLTSATGDFTFIPRALAVEFSPGLLVRGERLSLAEYRANPFWYRLRLSLATRRGEGEGARARIAFALRTSLQDESDLRTNAEFERAILALTRWERDSLRERELVRTQVLRIPVTQEPTEAQRAQLDSLVVERLHRPADTTELVRSVRARLGLAGVAELTPAQRQELDREVGLVTARLLGSRDLVAAVKRAREAALWNAGVFDVAVGVVSSAADSTGRGTRLDGVAGWLTKGWAFLPHAQLLLGARGAYERDSTDAAVATDLRATGDAVVRVYVGSNAYKVLGEAQATAQASSAPRWLANVGGELQLAEMLWLTASAGWQATGALGDGGIVSAFKIKLTPPGR
jgi:hypothetical protein